MTREKWNVSKNVYSNSSLYCFHFSFFLVHGKKKILLYRFHELGRACHTSDFIILLFNTRFLSRRGLGKKNYDAIPIRNHLWWWSFLVCAEKRVIICFSFFFSFFLLYFKRTVEYTKHFLLFSLYFFLF